MEQLLSEVRVSSEQEDLLMWTPESLDIDTWSEGQQLGPFGMENPAPELYSPYDGKIKISPLGRNGRHVKIELGPSTLLGFGAADMIRDR